MKIEKLHCARLELIQASEELLRATIKDLPLLSRLLNAQIPAGWPPPLTADAFEPLAEEITNDPAMAPWLFRYWVRQSADPSQRVLVGLGGFKGRPISGTVAIGYSVLEQYQRQGFATEAVSCMVGWAFEQQGVTRVIGETFPELKASIRVLEKNGFVFCGDGSDEPGAIRYELAKLRYEKMGG